MMDRQETQLRRSPFVLRDSALHDYVQDIACRLGGAHCPDIRVHLVRTPLFNANMAPNGMMQIWTGLMLRVDNEAQLAAVLGHEMGHYLARHSVERLRDAKTRSAFGSFLGMFGLVGAVGALATLAGAFGYSRDHERQADVIGLTLMRNAGYDPYEASKVWDNLLMELKAKPGGDPSKSPMFATHPPAEERKETLARLAAEAPGGVKNDAAWAEHTRAYRRDWLAEEVRRGQHEESLALLTRKIALPGAGPDFLSARGDVHRLRGQEGDFDAALADYTAAVALGGEQPETHRGLGLLYRARKQSPEARTSFERYLQLAPEAPDAGMIKSYLEGLDT
jgi:beta-barrel assembly-enhancing protease